MEDFTNLTYIEKIDFLFSDFKRSVSVDVFMSF